MRFFQRQFQTDVDEGDFALDQNGNSRTEVVEQIGEMTIQVAGSFTASVQVQGAIGSGPLQNIGTAVNAPAFIDLPTSLSRVRLVISGLSGGEVNAWLGGVDRRAQ
jgi:hypothetical protein